MADKTNIQWCDATWNIAVGCSKVDADCTFCYMYRDSLKSTRYNPKVVTKTKTVFNFPLKYKETKSKVWNGEPLIFTSSLTDFFHKDCDSFRNEAWDIIRQCKHLIFLILTKRPERINDHLPDDWGQGWDNVWFGTSCGRPASTHRIKELMKVRCKTRFLSIEPLYQRIDITNKGIDDGYNFPTRYDEFTGKGIEWLDPADHFIGVDWVIVGGESGNKGMYRPCDTEWIEKVINACRASKVPVFVKQMGTHLAKEMNLKHRHGGDINEWPEHLQVREFPVRKRAISFPTGTGKSVVITKKQ